ncbi:MAG: gamma-glutamyl-gamma-aminobutyrate hydrolase family protein [Pseudomonadota bacterium]
MVAPLIALPADPLTHRNLVWSATPASYIEALAREGLQAIQVPTTAAATDVGAILDVVSGVLITGARSNVHPTRYGAPVTEAAEPFDPARDAVSLPMIREAVARGLPLLGLCRGIQEINVAFGGTLHAAVHDVPGRAVHYSEMEDDIDAWFGMRHEVDVAPGLLRDIVGTDRVRVNSLHYQAIDAVAPGASVLATAPDGTIEAITLTGAAAFNLGVQWHPEHWAGRDGPSTAIFEAFARAVRARARGRQAA